MSLPTYHLVSGAPQPVGPFCHASEADGWIFVTGQMPTDPNDPDAPLAVDIEAQTVRVLENLKRVLSGLGLGFENVTMVRIYLTDFEVNFPRMNAIYKTYFPDGARPARTTVGVTALAVKAQVEIDLVARRP